MFKVWEWCRDKQNRSTEGCSKLKRSVDMTSPGKNGLNIRTNHTIHLVQIVGLIILFTLNVQFINCCKRCKCIKGTNQSQAAEKRDKEKGRMLFVIYSYLLVTFHFPLWLFDRYILEKTPRCTCNEYLHAHCSAQCWTTVLIPNKLR